MDAESVETARASVAAMAAAHPEDAGRLDAALAAIGRELNDDPDTIGDLRHGDQRSRAIRTRIHGKTMAQIIESGERAAQNAAAEAAASAEATVARRPSDPGPALKRYESKVTWPAGQPFWDMLKRFQVADIKVDRSGPTPDVVIGVRNGTPTYIVAAEVGFSARSTDGKPDASRRMHCVNHVGLAPGSFGQMSCGASHVDTVQLGGVTNFYVHSVYYAGYEYGRETALPVFGDGSK